MTHFLDFTTWDRKRLLAFFATVDEFANRDAAFQGKTFVLFFPETSIRTRVTFEKGIIQQGGQVISFPTTTLDKKEALQDVIGYLSNWADMVILRHPEKAVITELAQHSDVPIINAMTNTDHPCEILADLYSLSKRRPDFLELNYLFVGGNENIGHTWAKAAEKFAFNFAQCSPAEFRIPGVTHFTDIQRGIKHQDVILTDPVLPANQTLFASFQITKALMDKANDGALLNPCPPFYRGQEVSAAAIASDYFVGYDFKQALVEVQQGIMQFCFEDLS